MDAQEEVIITTEESINNNVDSKKYNLPEGLTKMQKKNMRKVLRDKDKKLNKQVDKPGNEKKIKPVEDPLQPKRQKILKRIKSTFEGLEQLNSDSISAEDAKSQVAVLDKLISELDEANMNLNIEVEKTGLRNINYAQMMKNYETLASLPDANESEIEKLYEQLKSHLMYRNARKMQVDFADLKKKIVNRKNEARYVIYQAIQNKKNTVLLSRIKNALLKKDPNFPVNTHVTVSNVTTQKIMITPNILTELLPPSNLLHGIRVRYGVLIERITQSTNFLVVSGLKEDVEKVAQFLQQADFTGKYSLAIDSKLIPLIIGLQGSNVQKLEEQYNCFIRVFETTLKVIGTPENAAAALAVLKKAVEEKQHETKIKERVDFKHPAIGQALLSKFIPQLRNIENTCDVRVRVMQNESEDADAADSANKCGFLHVTGKHRNIKKGLTEVEDFLNGLKVVEIFSQNPVSISRLFEKFSRGSTSTYHHAYAQQFRRLILAADKVAFIKQPDSIVLVSQTEISPSYVESIEQLLTNVSFEPIQYCVPNESVFVYNNKVILNIEVDTNTNIQRLSVNDDHTVFDIIGDTASQEKARAAMDHVLKTKAVVEVVQLYPALEKARAKLRNIENNHSVRLYVDTDNQVLKIVGQVQNIEKAKEALDVFVHMKANNADSQTVFEDKTLRRKNLNKEQSAQMTKVRQKRVTNRQTKTLYQ